MSGKFWTQSWSPIPRLLNIPGKRWLCVEPLLGPVDLGLFCPRCGYSNYDCRVQMDHRLCGAPEPPRIDWVVVGQESGPGARPAKAEWIQSIIDQCKTAHIPVWTKALPPGVNPIRQAPALIATILKADEKITRASGERQNRCNHGRAKSHSADLDSDSR